VTPDEYYNYLASPHWRLTRRRAIQRAGHRCQECGGYWTRERPLRLEVHHLTYARVGKERPGDLAVLCEACHEQAHGVPLEHTTAPGPERAGDIANRVLHFMRLRRPREHAG